MNPVSGLLGLARGSMRGDGAKPGAAKRVVQAAGGGRRRVVRGHLGQGPRRQVLPPALVRPLEHPEASRRGVRVEVTKKQDGEKVRRSSFYFTLFTFLSNWLRPWLGIEEDLDWSPSFPNPRLINSTIQRCDLRTRFCPFRLIVNF